MPVFVYDNTGLVESADESQWKNIGHAVHAHNLENPAQKRRLLVGPAFPPPNWVFDPAIGDLRLKKLSEQINDGELSLPEGAVLAVGADGEVIVSPGLRLDESGRLVSKTIEEKIADGETPFDPQRQKVENGAIVPKTLQEMVNDGVVTISEVLQQSQQRLRITVESYLSSNTTPNGYHLDSLARQKAGLTMQYRQLPDTDPVKADLLQRKVIYTDAIVDEILNEVERVQSAYDQAKNTLQSIANQNQPVSVFDSVKLEDYLGAP
jgi:hypothetical protein